MNSLLKQASWIQQDPPNFFWVSLFFHALFFILFYYFSGYSNSPKIEKSYYYYVPAYASPSMPMVSTAKKNIQKDENVKKTALPLNKSYDLSQFKPKNSYQDTYKNFETIIQPNRSKYMEAIHLVGDKFLDDPLKKLLGRAITARLYYPDIARELNMRGVVSVGFTLHPNGEITDAKIIKTSREQILDVAAINAIKSAAPIDNVSLYVKQPRYLVVNIIF